MSFGQTKSLYWPRGRRVDIRSTAVLNSPVLKEQDEAEMQRLARKQEKKALTLPELQKLNGFLDRKKVERNGEKKKPPQR